ncbi:hypothetical protein GCM10009678_04210 [Actinomadura kijaniata]|uniref:Stress response protein YsnF n=1 Tax=Actinomadura namibiensis TaxID=182080 RepID=A0A7W3LTH4_ACTNM|nr:DUF2382 domain-containing protein [Actinomadura namibiensis]MBA8954008.1 stress response protein YsnF [Actinomadura namibiensis]
MTTREHHLVGRRLVGSDGEELGTVTRVVHAENSEAPEWLVIRYGLFGMRERLVPYAGARTTEEEISVPLDREMVRSSPDVDLEQGLTTADEEALARHYHRGPHGTLPGSPPPASFEKHRMTEAKATADGTPPPQARPMATERPAATPPTPKADRPVAGQRQWKTEETRPSATSDDSTPRPENARTENMRAENMRAENRGQVRQPAPEKPTAGERDGNEVELTRYEERLSVDKRVEEAARVKIRRVVERQEHDQTVAVLADDYDIVRQPIEGGKAEQHAMGEDEQELILYRERLVVTKVAVPVERVVLRRKKAEKRQTVRETLAKERIEVEKVDVPVQPAQERARAGGRTAR